MKPVAARNSECVVFKVKTVVRERSVPRNVENEIFSVCAMESQPLKHWLDWIVTSLGKPTLLSGRGLNC
jgi:hypothetical protein